MFGAPLPLTAVTISPSPRFAQLAAALAVTGIGVGATVVPITSSALSAVPPERSGMAASAANTSREIGAVLGVAVLGALVNSQSARRSDQPAAPARDPGQLPGHRDQCDRDRDRPPNSQAASAGGAASQGQGQAKLVQDVIDAAYAAFYSGLQAALFVAAGLVLAAGLFTFIMLKKPGPPPGDTSNPLLADASGPHGSG